MVLLPFSSWRPLCVYARASASGLLPVYPFEPRTRAAQPVLAEVFSAAAQGAQDAIAKAPNGTCPFGWISSGSFCLRREPPAASGTSRRSHANARLP